MLKTASSDIQRRAFLFSAVRGVRSKTRRKRSLAAGATCRAKETLVQRAWKAGKTDRGSLTTTSFSDPATNKDGDGDETRTSEIYEPATHGIASGQNGLTLPGELDYDNVSAPSRSLNHSRCTISSLFAPHFNGLNMSLGHLPPRPVRSKTEANIVRHRAS